MQVTQFRAEVYAEGFSEQSSFEIDATGKAFKGLIDGIYSRKIEAIIRELSTNAFDAQIEAAYIGPFEVHLPSVMSPVFWVRDFGVGMTHEFVMTRYKRLFNSTKDGATPADYRATTPAGITEEANKQVGQLGLGSKVFFAYTDACTLTVWQDGIKRVYSVFMGGDGVPQVALAGAIESDEPAGVKVEFAVKNKDIQEFAKSAIRVFKGFPYTPKGLGDDVLSHLSVEPTMIGTGWKAYPKDHLPDVPYYAKQGCVLYPIDLAQLDSKAVEDDDGNLVMSEGFEQYKNTNSTIVLEFPIGSINFDLSRERLSYDDLTIKSLRQGWDRFHADITRSFKTTFEGVRGGYQLAMVAEDTDANKFGPLFSVTPQAITIEATKEALKKAFPRYNSDRDGACLALAYGLGSDGKVSRFRDRRNYGAPKTADMLGALYLYSDGPVKNVQARLARYMKENDYKFAFIFATGKLTVKKHRQLGQLPIMRMTDLPDLPKEEKERLARGGGGAFKRFKDFVCFDELRSMDEEEVNDLDPETTYYALINKGTLLKEGGPYFRLYDAAVMNSILLKLGMGKVVMINTRITEAEDRWPRDEYPRWTEAITRILDEVTPEQLHQFATYFNYRQYKESIYHQAAGVIRSVTKRGNPITAMRRYETRYKKLPRSVQDLWQQVMVAATDVSNWSHYSYSTDYTLFDDLFHGLIELCRQHGIELLPPMDKYSSNGKKAGTNHRLLPKRWHSLALAMCESHYDNFKTYYFQGKMKEYNAPC